MPPSLLARRRKSQESKVEIGKYIFTIKRPSVREAIAIETEKLNPIDVAERFTIDWDGVTEADLAPQGTTEPVAFDKALWLDWLDDRPDFWVPIYDAVIKAYTKHNDERDDLVKNSQPG